MLPALLIGLREGIEASLIIGMVLALLRQSGALGMRKWLWLGTFSAILASLLGALVIASIWGSLAGRSEKIFEALLMFVAVALMTWLLYWLRHFAAAHRNALATGVEGAMASGSGWSLFLLAFVAVFREGIESVLFLFAASRRDSAEMVTSGALLGLLLAICVGVLFYRGIISLALRRVLQVSAVVLVLFAAGLLAHGVHELQEAAVLPIWLHEVWNTQVFLSDKSIVGSVLRSVFGYNDNPTFIEFLAYLSYLLVACFGFLAPLFSQRPAAAPSAQKI
ncbi:MAG TPA: hypothetical protein EYN66_18410 [Myxococcales bacterium]|nr:hypothetical protein [Myxococcales bacterium]HIB77466.1 hypothetical protein [Flavobacteriales bacterium]